MIVFTSDNKRFVDVGSDALWRSILYTMKTYVSDYSEKMQQIYCFLESGFCDMSDTQEAARQMNLLRDFFSSLEPQLVVFEKDDKLCLEKENISPVTTSCANVYITSDGKDLLYEIVSILTYASVLKVDVLSEGYSQINYVQ